MRVTLLTQEDCHFCEQAKDVLRRLASEYPISVEELDLATPAGQRLAEQGGVLFAPGIVLDGEPFSYGRPSERKLRRELKRRAAPR